MRIARDCWKCEYEDCGHEWIAKGPEPPDQCAKCRRRKWHTPEVSPTQNRKVRKPSKPKVEAAVEAVAAIGETIVPAAVIPAPKTNSPGKCPTCSAKLLDWGTSWRCVPCKKNLPK